MFRCSCGSQKFKAKEEFILVETRVISKNGDINSKVNRSKERADAEYQKSLECLECDKSYCIIEEFNDINSLKDLKYISIDDIDYGMYFGEALITQKYYDELSLEDKKKWACISKVQREHIL